MPGSALFGEVFAGIGQENTPIWFRCDETFADEPLNCFGNCDFTNAESFGKISCAGFATLGDEIIDQLHVIFGGFLAMVGAGALVLV